MVSSPQDAGEGSKRDRTMTADSEQVHVVKKAPAVGLDDNSIVSGADHERRVSPDPVAGSVRFGKERGIGGAGANP